MNQGQVTAMENHSQTNTAGATSISRHSTRAATNLAMAMEDHSQTNTAVATSTSNQTAAITNQDQTESKLLYDLLTNSISSTGLARISKWKDQYHIPIGGVPFGADLWFLKIIRLD